MFALVLLLLALVTLTQVMRARRRRRPDEPPLVQGWIPYLGKALEFRRDSFSFLEDLRRKHGDVFTVLIAGRYMTFITNPLHFPAIIKHGRHMDFHEFTDLMAAYTFGYTPVTSERFPGVMEKINGSFNLLQGPHLPHLAESMMRNQLLVFREDHLSCGQSREWKISHLHDFCLSVALEAAFMTLYGRSPSDHRHKDLQKIKQDFLSFDQKLPLLMGKVPLWLLGDLRSVRQRLIERFVPSVMSEWGDPSLFVQRRRLLFDQHSFSTLDAAAHHFALLWASVGNTSPTMFWCVYHLLRNQEALRAVRAEIQELMSQEGLELRLDSDLVLTQEQMDRLVVLGSVVSESLRLSTMSLNMRVALEDFSLRPDPASSWSIRKGDMIALCPHSAHLDPEIYQDPTSFQFDRFLDDGKEKTDFYKSGQRLKYYLMPFGSGATMCPGRFLALHQIKQFVCLLVLLFDMELCDPDVEVPMDLSRAGLGIMHPAHDVRFRSGGGGVSSLWSSSGLGLVLESAAVLGLCPTPKSAGATDLHSGPQWVSGSLSVLGPIHSSGLWVLSAHGQPPDGVQRPCPSPGPRPSRHLHPVPVSDQPVCCCGDRCGCDRRNLQCAPDRNTPPAGGGVPVRVRG